MKIILNKIQWRQIGIEAGWIKKADISDIDSKYIASINNEDYETAKNLVVQAAELAVEKEFRHHYTGYIQENAYKRYKQPGGLNWMGPKSKHPVLLLEKDGIEYRQSGEKLKYTFYNEETLEHKRDQNGNLIYKTDDEMRRENLPMYDTTIIAYDNDKVIGLASNEFGAVGIWVDPEYQKRGIGKTLLNEHMKQRLKKPKIGQMTDEGIALTKSWIRSNQDRSIVLYDKSGNVIPLSERFGLN